MRTPPPELVLAPLDPTTPGLHPRPQALDRRGSDHERKDLHAHLLRHPADRRQTPRQLIGGFRQYAATQEQGDAFFCIVDLHSITIDYDPADLHARTLDLYAMLIATGLDPERSTVFAQSHVTAHAEASWLLSAVTSYGQLGRMTQFKDKSATPDFVSSGLFTYPVLMAGDILLYQADIVPIGDDQRQHLELARDIAERFNARFGETFTVPAGVYPEVGARIMDLQEPTREDVNDGRHRAGHGRHARRARRDPQEVPIGGDRLRSRGAAGRRQAGRLEPDRHPLGRYRAAAPRRSRREYGDGGLRHVQGRTSGEAVVALLAPIHERYAELRADEGELLRLLALGADKARATSTPTLERMYETMGFVRLRRLGAASAATGELATARRASEAPRPRRASAAATPRSAPC